MELVSEDTSLSTLSSHVDQEVPDMVGGGEGGEKLPGFSNPSRVLAF